MGGYGAFEQGSGLIQVPAAWALLATNATTVDVSSAVAVDTALEQFLAAPGVGVGIRDREGVTIGRPYTRTYTFTRTSGTGGATTYYPSLAGNDGTIADPTPGEWSWSSTDLRCPQVQLSTTTSTWSRTQHSGH